MAQVTRDVFLVPARACPKVLALGPRLHPQPGLKRLIDVVVSLILIVFASPILLIAACAIKLTSHGPALYVGRRVGYLGREFSFWKLRTMVDGASSHQDEVANEKDEVVFKNRRDPRITPVGRFLRKYSIDELPQLVHVLRGEMSLVGPRPPLPAEVREYLDEDRVRLTVKPGLTCYWQIMGRSDLSFAEWMDLDRRYVREQSLATDIKILLKTPFAVISGRGAY
jgi:lipopolysaccharide/colanic/teichoic acid biosynthesis glycosyltransferase